MRRSWLIAVLLAAMLPLAVPGPSAHAAGCRPLTKRMSGTIKGSDGRAVNALIGFAYFDASNHKLTSTGCAMTVAGYSRTLSVNRTLPVSGGSGVTTWSILLPSNAAYVWIENYPKNPPNGYYTDQTHYGQSMRRKVGATALGVNLRLPVVCEAGGTTGGIWGVAKHNGVGVKASRVTAWSVAPDSNTMILGWNIGSSADNGFYKVLHLASGQKYSLWVTWNGITKRFVNIPVTSCHNTPLFVYF